MLWGGRFEEEPDRIAFEFSSSLKEDILLIKEEILCGKAYAEMLCRIGIITNIELNSITEALSSIQSEYDNKLWNPDPKVFEDIHSAIETRLYELLGETAGKLRAGRSRNDQVVTSVRMWTKKSAVNIINLLSNLQNSFIKTAELHVETIIPGYTHLQHAQPVSLAHHLLAYIEMFERDKERFSSVINSADNMPLGSGALAGSTLPLDTNYLKEKLGFNSLCNNSMDAVSDRDFVIDFLNSCSIGMMHLTRFCEEIIIWSTSEWKFAKIGDSFTTGSSLMPQKKNPDIAELIRGKSARVFSNYQSVITLMKGLPLTYNRDMQEDKHSLFSSYSIYSDSLKLMKGMFETIKFDNTHLLSLMKKSTILATDAADWLVLKGIPFREAHDIVGELVKYCLKNEKGFADLTIPELKQINSQFDESVLEVFKLENSLCRKKTPGSPNPKFVKEQISTWKSILSF
ncbi:MAG: argininosuccinate lyase [Ignavibacteriaceae bacterium]|nr:argininosuccinate lyase [Ignavibacteriaceae bacterium]